MRSRIIGSIPIEQGNWESLYRMVSDRHTAWFRELYCYAEHDIFQKLDLSADKGQELIEQLLKNNILHHGSKSSKSNDEVLPEDINCLGVLILY